MPVKDLSGKDILNVHVNYLDHVNGRSYWNVTCVCGKEFVVDANKLKQNTSLITCGNNEYHNIITNYEKETFPHIFNTYRSYMNRVFNKNGQDYKDYGMRGITVSEDFKNYYKFKEWAINNGYEDGLSLDRIDVNDNYSADNVRWATDQEQALNKRHSSDKHVGIYKSKYGTYKARVKRNQKATHLGTYKTFDEAYQARQKFIRGN